MSFSIIPFRLCAFPGLVLAVLMAASSAAPASAGETASAVPALALDDFLISRKSADTAPREKAAATPPSGLNVDFLGWGGCTSVSGANGTVCTIVVSGDHIATATFK